MPFSADSGMLTNSLKQSCWITVSFCQDGADYVRRADTP